MTPEEIREFERLKREQRRERAAEAMWTPLSWVPYTAALPQPYAVNGDTHIAAQPGIPLTLAVWSTATNVTAPNDGANYWTVSLLLVGTSVIASFTTAADTAATWTRHDVTSGWTNPIATTNEAFGIRIARTGAPGSIYLAPSLWVRNGSA